MRPSSVIFWVFSRSHWMISNRLARSLSSMPRFQAIRQLREENEVLIISKLKEQLTKENVDIIGPLITEHTIFLERVRKEHSPRGKRAKFEQKKREVQVLAFQLERDIIQNMFEKGGISRDLARDLRQNLNMIETYLYDDFLE